MKETVVMINKTKTWSFEKINKIAFSQTHQEKREVNQIHKLRNEKGEVTTDNAEIQRIIRNYYEQPYGSKTDNLDKMYRFLGKFNLQKKKTKQNRKK